MAEQNHTIPDEKGEVRPVFSSARKKAGPQQHAGNRRRERRMIASITNVSDLSAPPLAPYLTLRRNEEQNRAGIFVAEGNKVVMRLLASEIEIISILLTETWLEQCQEELERRREPVAVCCAPTDMVKSIVGFNYHQGIMAVARIPERISIHEACVRHSGPRLFVALDFISNSENGGVVLRNCVACGVQTVIAGETSADPWLRRSVRNSMGAVFRLSVVRSENLAQTLHTLRNQYGFTVIAAHVRPWSVSMHNVDFTRDCCIVLGNEQQGVSDGVAAQCDKIAAIPMHDGVDSFNVGCASAIMLYEASKQRRSVLPSGDAT